MEESVVNQNPRQKQSAGARGASSAKRENVQRRIPPSLSLASRPGDLSPLASPAEETRRLFR